MMRGAEGRKHTTGSDPRVQNPQLRRIHNVAVVQSRKGWTKAEAFQAITDANAGITYPIPQLVDKEG